MMSINTRYCILLVVSCTLTACKNVEQQKENPALSDKIEQALNKKDFKYLDLAEISNTDWDRICVISPYSTNQHAQKIIGFQWDVENNSDISGSDRINLLLFIKSDRVVEYVQHPRYKGDFTNLKPPCLPRENAMLALDGTNQQWLYLVKK